MSNWQPKSKGNKKNFGIGYMNGERLRRRKYKHPDINSYDIKSKEIYLERIRKQEAIREKVRKEFEYTLWCMNYLWKIKEYEGYEYSRILKFIFKCVCDDDMKPLIRYVEKYRKNQTEDEIKLFEEKNNNNLKKRNKRISNQLNKIDKVEKEYGFEQKTFFDDDKNYVVDEEEECSGKVKRFV